MYRRYGMGEASIEQPVAPAPATAFQEALSQMDPSEEHGGYLFEQTLLQNGQAIDVVVPIDGDSDFLLTHLKGIATAAYSVNYRDFGGRPVYSSATDSRNVVGTGQLPVELEVPLLFPAGGQIKVSVYDKNNVGGNSIEILFCGIRKFRT